MHYYSHYLCLYRNFVRLGEESLAVFIYLCGAAAMAVPTFNFSFRYVFISFLVLEAMVGMFYSCGGILRSKYYPEAHQSSIMSVFRVPLNAIVVIGKGLNYRNESLDIRLVTARALPPLLNSCVRLSNCDYITNNDLTDCFPGTLLTNNASSVESIQKVLRLITVMHMLAMVLQICLKFCGPKHLHDSKDSKKMD